MISALHNGGMTVASLRSAASLCLRFGQLIYYPADHANALKKIIDANVFIGTMRIRSSVADAKRRHRSRR
jgi:hypothetical protein